MARYSSDSDSDRSSRHRRKNYRRSRTSSSDSSDSSSYKRKSSKHSKTKRRHRSRTRSRDRDRSSKSYKYSRDSSRDREKRRQKSRRSKSPSSSQKKQKRSVSREKSTSRSSSSQSIVKPVALEKVQNTKEDFSIAPSIKESILEEINSEGFAPKHFTSSAQNKETKSKNIVIDITSDTIVVPPVPPIIQSDSIFHQSIIEDQEAKFDKWVKKLYLIRQKAQFESIQ